jgi:hypothetical protein
VSDDRKLVAGDFSAWADAMRLAIREQRDSDVPCNGCTACCRSSQFVHIAPDETETLAHIPTELLFPAPGRPRGHVVLGYDERGHCPMLIDDQCSIYEHRPNACRTYDCRVFAAAGIDAGAEKPEITHRVRRWVFSFPAPDDRTERDAVLAAAAFLGDRPDMMRDAGIPENETQLAVAAFDVHEVFLHRDEQTGRLAVIEPDASVVRAALTSR